jgi:hypothetical protein
VHVDKLRKALSSSRSSSGGAVAVSTELLATAKSLTARRHAFVLRVVQQWLPLVSGAQLCRFVVPLALRYAESPDAALQARAHKVMQTSLYELLKYARQPLVAPTASAIKSATFGKLDAVSCEALAVAMNAARNSAAAGDKRSAAAHKAYAQFADRLVPSYVRVTLKHFPKTTDARQVSWLYVMLLHSIGPAEHDRILLLFDLLVTRLQDIIHDDIKAQLWAAQQQQLQQQRLVGGGSDGGGNNNSGKNSRVQLTFSKEAMRGIGPLLTLAMQLIQLVDVALVDAILFRLTQLLESMAGNQLAVMRKTLARGVQHALSRNFDLYKKKKCIKWYLRHCRL